MIGKKSSKLFCGHVHACQGWTQGLSRGPEKEGGRGHTGVRAHTQQAPTDGLTGRRLEGRG